MKKYRILLLVAESLVPPESIEGIDLGTVDWKTEYDVLVTLRFWDHEVHVVPVGDSLGVIRHAIEEYQPHIVFNLLEEFAGMSTMDTNIVGYLELLKVPYTGCNSRGLMLAKDKAISKKILRYHRIPTPAFFVCRKGSVPRLPRRLAFPVIVKSLTEDASLGISQASVVSSDEKLRERTQFIHEQIGTDAIVEEYIDGREFYVGILGNARLQAFPVWELKFDGVAEGVIPIATRHVKWNDSYRDKHKIRSGRAANLSDAETAQIHSLAKRAYRRLELSGCARMDLRHTKDGRTYLIEANPNPGISYGEEFPEAGELVGISYEKLIPRLISLGLSWHTRRR